MNFIVVAGMVIIGLAVSAIRGWKRRSTGQRKSAADTSQQAPEPDLPNGLFSIFSPTTSESESPRIEQWRASPLVAVHETGETRRTGPLERVESLPRAKRAVVWSEILAPPVSER